VRSRAQCAGGTWPARSIIHLELVGIVLILLMAAMMAKGVGVTL
jgi:uncharacterized membrane protein